MDHFGYLGDYMGDLAFDPTQSLGDLAFDPAAARRNPAHRNPVSALLAKLNPFSALQNEGEGEPMSNTTKIVIALAAVGAGYLAYQRGYLNFILPAGAQAMANPKKGKKSKKAKGKAKSKSTAKSTAKKGAKKSAKKASTKKSSAKKGAKKAKVKAGGVCVAKNGRPYIFVKGRPRFISDAKAKSMGLSIKR